MHTNAACGTMPPPMATSDPRAGIRNMPKKQDSTTNEAAGKPKSKGQKQAPSKSSKTAKPLKVHLADHERKWLVAIQHYHNLSSEAEVIRFMLGKEIRAIGSPLAPGQQS